MTKLLCIIPARSGSKSLPHKNIKILGDKPLLAWSIQQALEYKEKYYQNMRIIVSTDSLEYANIAIKYGAEVPFIRPAEISGDLSTDFECIKHCVDTLAKDNYYPDVILQLRPTQPLRQVEDIHKCVKLFLENINNYDSLRTVVPVSKTPYKMYEIYNNKLVPLFKEVNNIHEPYNQCRQILPITYLHNGYIDILKTSILEKNTISGENILPYIMDEKNIYDIDTQNDWNITNKCIEKFVD